MVQEEYFEDAEIEDLPRGTWLGSWLRGIVTGTVLFGAGAVGLSLVIPLPDHLPGVGKVRIVRPPSPEAPAVVPVAQPEGQTDAETKVEIGDGAAPDDPVAGDGLAVGQPAEEDSVAAPGKDLTLAEPGDDPAARGAGEDPAKTGAGEEIAALPLADKADAGQGDAPTAVADDPLADATPVVVSAPAVLVPGVPRDVVADTLALLDDARVGVQGTRLPESGPVAVPPDSARPAAPLPAAQPIAAVPQGTPAEPDSPGGLPIDLPGATRPADAGPAQVGDLAVLAPQGTVQAQPSPPVPKIVLSGPARDVNARAFDAPGGAPLISVVLMDAGNGSIPEDALALMTMPLTVSVRPNGDARRLAELARAFGHEVLVELPMASGAGVQAGLMTEVQSDQTLVAQTIRYMADLDVAVGITGPDGAPLMRDQARMTAILNALVEHGFLWLDPRLGTGSRTEYAARETGVVWSAGDRLINTPATEEQIYQNLESAAFQARRNGTVIVFLPTSPDALKALVRWGLERGGQEVWFAPVSAAVARRQKTP